MSRWINLLALLPGTSLTLLVISIAFLRFYDQTDFLLLGKLADPRLWSNRLTVAALLVAVVNLGVEWNRRNRETDRQARAEAESVAEEQRRVAEEQRRVEESEQAARRTRIEVERDLALLSFLSDPSEQNRTVLRQTVALFLEYRDSL
ncbi:MAG: hypothetical protein ACFCVD_09135 [Nodosilinea sp.]